MIKKIVWLASVTLLSWTQVANSMVFTTYNSQSDFQTALSASFTRIDFDDAGFSKIGAVVPSDARFAAFGLDVINGNPGFTTLGVSAASYPAAIGGPTWAMFNGLATPSTADDFAVNFDGGVNGFGFAPNTIDGGVITYYSGDNLTGTLLGTAINNGSGAFVGATSDMLIRSAQITCEFNFDYICGITDPQFGTFATTTASPATLSLLGVAAIALFSTAKRRKA
jgi:hypothetical protein